MKHLCFKVWGNTTVGCRDSLRRSREHLTALLRALAVSKLPAREGTAFSTGHRRVSAMRFQASGSQNHSRKGNSEAPTRDGTGLATARYAPPPDRTVHPGRKREEVSLGGGVSFHTPARVLGINSG